MYDCHVKFCVKNIIYIRKRELLKLKEEKYDYDLRTLS